MLRGSDGEESAAPRATFVRPTITHPTDMSDPCRRSNGSHRYKRNAPKALREVIQQTKDPAGIVNEYTHDIETEDQRSVEVKTKRRKHPPRPEWTVSMTLASWHRQSAAADVLAFAQVTPDLSRGWLLGFCTPEHFDCES